LSQLDDKTPTLRELIKEPQMAIGVFDPYSALLVERAGFKVCYLSGAALSGSLAMPDLGLLTLTEVVDMVRRIKSVINIPLIVDADTGFGEAINVERAVRELEAAGAAAIQIEDQEMPKKCGHLSEKRVVSPDLMVQKILAAKEARRTKEFLIIARIDSREAKGLDDAIYRAQLYKEAGADIIFPEALESPEEFAKFRKAVKGPLLANMTEFGKTPYIPFRTFVELGYQLVLYPVTLFRLASRAMQEGLKVLKEQGTQITLLPMMTSRDEFYGLIDYWRYEESDKALAERAEKLVHDFSLGRSG
jgi:methylisocitrate lyase